MVIRGWISERFEQWGRFVVRHPWPVIVLMLVAALGVGAALPGMQVDNSVEAFLHEDDPNLLHYNDFRDRFGRDDVTVITIRPHDIFDIAFLEKLRAMHEDLENEVPYLDELTSLVNARATYGEGDELVVDELLAEWPRDQADLAALRARVFANPLYLDTLISRDGRFTTVTLEPVVYSPTALGEEALSGFEDEGTSQSDSPGERRYLNDLESADMVKAVRQVMHRYQDADTEMFLAGTAVMEERLEDEMQADLVRFLSLSILVIVVVLYAVFRRASGVALPLLTVILSLITTLGGMALLGISLSLTTEILPSFLLTVGVCYSVHIITIFFQGLDRGLVREDAIRHALSHSGLAVLMTGLTTAGGLASFSQAEVAPVAELGIIGPLGVILAMIFALVFLPALLAVIPLSKSAARSQRRSGALLSGAVVACGGFSARRPWLVLVGAAVLIVVASVGVSRLRFANDYFLWFPDGEPLVEATRLMDRELRGVVTLEAIVETGVENGLHDPDLLRKLADIGEANSSFRQGDLFVGKTISVADILKETHQALNENRAAYYTIPDNPQLVAQELLLFENGGAEDLEELVDSQFSTARISMKIPWTDWMLYPELITEMRHHLRSILGPDVPFHLTGFCTVMARAAESFVTTMVQSYTLALLIITPLMIFLLGSFRRGLLSMVPNLTPILLTLGLMGWLDIPLDMSTTLIGGIIIGLAVDDTIHFMDRFNRYFEQTHDANRAVRETLETAGTAMLFTSVVLGAGFLAFTFAYMQNVVEFGLLCAFATVAAFVADITLAPSLMVLVTRRQGKTVAGPVVDGVAQID